MAATDALRTTRDPPGGRHDPRDRDVIVCRLLSRPCLTACPIGRSGTSVSEAAADEDATVAELRRAGRAL